MLTESGQIRHLPLMTRNEESEDSFELQQLVRKLSAAVVVRREMILRLLRRESLFAINFVAIVQSLSLIQTLFSY